MGVVDDYLQANGYVDVSMWALDSDYHYEGGEWFDEHGNLVNIEDCLESVVIELMADNF